ncbi:Cache sensor hybrid histidine kinase [Nostoc carneum NIES-2107]|nr:Cache sensor hybrid histidine kinase [Nostoc carneum NIES-2107]
MTYPGVANCQKLPLRLIVVVSFLIPVFAAVGLVGDLCFKNRQKAVNSLVEQLMSQVNKLVNQHLNTYLATPHQIHQINADAIEVGLVNLRNFRGSGRYFCKQIQVFKDIDYNGYALITDVGRWLERISNPLYLSWDCSADFEMSTSK